MNEVSTKLELRTRRVTVPEYEASGIVVDIFNRLGCQNEISRAISDHLIDANLCGMESHGVMRVMQYAERILMVPCGLMFNQKPVQPNME